MNMECTLLVLETSGTQASSAHSAHGKAVFIQSPLLINTSNYHKT